MHYKHTPKSDPASPLDFSGQPSDGWPDDSGELQPTGNSHATPPPANSGPTHHSGIVSSRQTGAPPPPLPSVLALGVGGQSGAHVAVRATAHRETGPAGAHVVRSRAYSFVLDARGLPIEVGSGRFAKAYLGEERWLESKTDFRREVVIKVLQRGVSDDDRLRFQIEKELLERVQGHPTIITLYASGESDDSAFIPASIRDKVENDFMILERMHMSLEERLKGSRAKGKREDLLACDVHDRIFRVLDYMIPIASAIEYAHLIRSISHRDIKPANILLRLPDETLRGSTLEVRVADFNVAKLSDDDVSFEVTRLKSVPGTLFFQSPEQETNIIELLVNTQQNSPEIEYFEDFYIQIEKNDSLSLFNRNEEYEIVYADRQRKRIILSRPYAEAGEQNVRARVQKSVSRPADIYSLGALFYYLASGAYANPKSLYDALHKFIEYEGADTSNTVVDYLEHEYSVINSIRAPKSGDQSVAVAPADRFFSYKQYLDGNGELIDPRVMKIIARCMIRNKPDSYCQAHDIETRGISDLVRDLIELYAIYGFHPEAKPTQLARTRAMGRPRRWHGLNRVGSGLSRLWSRMWYRITSLDGRRK